MRIRVLINALLTATLTATLSAQTPSLADQYPTPLVHTPTNHPAQHILIVSIPGLHAATLATFVATHPASTLAMLSRRGVTFTDAHTPHPDSRAGLLALLTGGSAISTGIAAQQGYDRDLSPPASACATHGTPWSLAPGAIPPLDPQDHCHPVPPHALVRVNNLVEVIHEKVGPTAWAAQDAIEADLLTGPSGRGLDQNCPLAAGDTSRTNLVRAWITALGCTGSQLPATPVLLGLTLTRLATTPTQDLTPEDSLLATLVETLKARKLFDQTWIVVTAPYARNPPGLTLVAATKQGHPHQETAILSAAEAQRALTPAQRRTVAHIACTSTCSLWLRDPASAQQIASTLQQKTPYRIVSGPALSLTGNLPAQDSRAPDLILEPLLREDLTHVALLVSGVQLTGRLDKTPVPTTQLAPLLLRSLGLEKFDLQALHPEHTPALPGIF